MGGRSVVDIASYTNEWTHGACAGMSNELYHSHGSVSLSKLKMAIESLQYYHGRYVSGEMPGKTSDALRKGSAQHAYTLEGVEAFNSEFVEVANLPFRVKEDKWNSIMAMNETLFSPQPIDSLKELMTWKKDEVMAYFGALPGREHITKEEAITIKKVDAAVKAHPLAAALLAKGIPEVSFRSKHSEQNGYSIQCRPDWLNTEGCKASELVPYIADLKTVDSLERWNKNYYDFGYWLQEAFYLETIEASVGHRAAQKLFFIVAETQWPYRVVVKEPDPEDNELALHMILSGFNALTKAYTSDVWRDAGWDQLQTQSLKPWARREIENSI